MSVPRHAIAAILAFIVSLSMPFLALSSPDVPSGYNSYQALEMGPIMLGDSLQGAFGNLTSVNMSGFLSGHALGSGAYFQSIITGPSQIEYDNSDGDIYDPAYYVDVGTSCSSPAYTLHANFTGLGNFTGLVGSHITLFGKEYVITSQTTTTALYLREVGLSGVFEKGVNTTVSFNGSHDVYVINMTSWYAWADIDGVTRMMYPGSYCTYELPSGNMSVYLESLWGEMATIILGFEQLRLGNGDPAWTGENLASIDGTMCHLDSNPTTHLKVQVAMGNSDYDNITLGNQFTDPVFGTVITRFENLDTQGGWEEVFVDNSSLHSATVRFTGLGKQEKTLTWAVTPSGGAFSPELNSTSGRWVVAEGQDAMVNDYVVLGSWETPYYSNIVQVLSVTGAGSPGAYTELKDVLTGQVHNVSLSMSSDTAGNITLGETYHLNSTVGQALAFFWGAGSSPGSAGSKVTVYPPVTTSNWAWLAFTEPVQMSDGVAYELPTNSSFIYSSAQHDSTRPQFGRVRYNITPSGMIELDDLEDGYTGLMLLENGTADLNGNFVKDAVIFRITGVGSGPSMYLDVSSPVKTAATVQGATLSSDTYVTRYADRHGTIITYDSYGAGHVNVSYPEYPVYGNVTITGGDMTPGMDMGVESPYWIKYNTGSIEVNATTNLPADWCGYSLNGGAYQPLASLTATHWGANLTGLADGPYTMDFWCNGTERGSISYSGRQFTVDATSPYHWDTPQECNITGNRSYQGVTIYAKCNVTVNPGVTLVLNSTIFRMNISYHGENEFNVSQGAALIAEGSDIGSANSSLYFTLRHMGSTILVGTTTKETDMFGGTSIIAGSVIDGALFREDSRNTITGTESDYMMFADNSSSSVTNCSINTTHIDQASGSHTFIQDLAPGADVNKRISSQTTSFEVNISGTEIKEMMLTPYTTGEIRNSTINWTIFSSNQNVSFSRPSSTMDNVNIFGDSAVEGYFSWGQLTTFFWGWGSSLSRLFPIHVYEAGTSSGAGGIRLRAFENGSFLTDEAYTDVNGYTVMNITFYSNTHMDKHWIFLSTNSTGMYTENLTFTTSTAPDGIIMYADTTPPNITVMGPGDGYTVESGQVDFVYRPSDSVSTTLNCSLYVNGELNQSGTVYSGLNSAFSLQAGSLPVGNYTWHISCLDDWNNEANSSQSVLTIADLTPPQISESYVMQTKAMPGDNVTLYSTITDNRALDSAWALVSNSTWSGTAPLNHSCQQHTYPVTLEPGTYNITVFANDTANNMASRQMGSSLYLDHMEISEPVTLGLAIRNWYNDTFNITGMGVYENHSSMDLNVPRQAVNGLFYMSATVPRGLWRLHLGQGNDGIWIYDMEVIDNLTMMTAYLDRNITEAITDYPQGIRSVVEAIAVQVPFNFSSAYVRLNYSGTVDASHTRFWECHLWDMNARTCNGTWEDVTSNATIDTNSSTAMVQTGRFSAFLMSQETYCGDGVVDTGEECDDGNANSGDGCSSTCSVEASSNPPGGNGGGGGGGGGMTTITPPPSQCKANWTCTGWSACIDGTQSRACTDANSCGTGEGMPDTSRHCTIITDMCDASTFAIGPSGECRSFSVCEVPEGWEKVDSCPPAEAEPQDGITGMSVAIPSSIAAVAAALAVVILAGAFFWLRKPKAGPEN